MTDEEMRVAIARECGWEFRRCKYHGCNTWHSPSGVCADGNDYPVLPDYLNDLNAMAEAAKTIQCTKDLERYASWLCLWTTGGTAVPDVTLPTHKLALIAESTGRQRAEAFLRTIGKWKD